jgi:hypothetical protein
VLHDLGLRAVLPRIVELELFTQKVRLHLRQTTYVLLRDVDLTGRKDIPSQTIFLHRKNELLILREITLVCR